MSERPLLVEALVAEVLGPRSGPVETMAPYEDPVDEYIVGVLAPFEASSTEVDSDQELVGGDVSGADDDAPDLAGGATSSIGGASGGVLPPLTLDPRSRPASLGISIAVTSDSSPTLDICGTWARYVPGAEEGSTRVPHGAVWRGVDCSGSGPVSLSDPADPSVTLVIHSRPGGDGSWRISMFLVNRTPVASDGRADTAHHVFQPQIRVRCPDGVRLQPVERHRAVRDEEDAGLALLYADRPAFGRGHQCSALWRSIDPERPHPEAVHRRAAPFFWADGHHLFDPTTVADFSPADVRSEFAPVVPVNAPDKGWPGDAGNPPELDPAVLAQMYDGDTLRRALSPLADAYANWIDGQAELAGRPRGGSPAGRHLAACRAASERIRDGIELLATDDTARLAFCFANRAIAVQSGWTKGRVNPWWPFQLAFQLLNLRGIVETDHEDRELCDLLWFPTGGGKTEAYLGLAAFTMAHRRLASGSGGPTTGGGVAVLSRYTLRLLTVQQYRRAIALLTACELLRVQGAVGRRGWRPDSCTETTDLMWGAMRFSVGLWVGGNVTPNNLQDIEYRTATGSIVSEPGAISILEGRNGTGDPAQVLNCPACRSILAVPPDGFAAGMSVELHLVIGDPDPGAGPSVTSRMSADPFVVSQFRLTPHGKTPFATASIRFQLTGDATAEAVDNWFNKNILRELGPDAWLCAARASRPGYFIRQTEWGSRRGMKPIDFEIFCADPDCPLAADVAWTEATELGSRPVLPAFDRGDGQCDRSPVPAWTVDEQVYAHCPSMVVATVDKFARLAYEPRASSLFGNVDRLNEHLGYHRSWSPPTGPASLPAQPRQDVPAGRTVPVSGFRPPELILQDELHLIDGPLGSMVGLYETAVDILTAAGNTRTGPKYVASTATVRRAGEQVRSLYGRDLRVFPPQALRAEQTFFSSSAPAHPLDTGPGRLHVGLIAPGRGAQTPIVRTWTRLLQTPHDRRAQGVALADLDPFWTLVGYFNAIRELAGTVALVRQDIPQRLGSVAAVPRELDGQDPMELSSRASSLQLPSLLDELGVALGQARDPVGAVVATSMFGTGVDVDRLGLMVVHGQPKTTSAYIQATGRVGRRHGGLVVTLYRASRPRDLSHYEYFAGYHTTLYRHVEPVTVNPFAPRARDRALGPVAVSILRQAASLPGTTGSVPVQDRWRSQQRLAGGNWFCRASEMAGERNAPDVASLPDLFEARAAVQPSQRRPPPSDTAAHTDAELDRWQLLARQTGGQLLYYEPTVTRSASRPVVLGDLAHLVAGTGEAYEAAPTSLREVEATTTVEGWERS
ncbi:DISARM system helicase DrmA [Luedemannella helvata]|uniref:DISARM system helicase DrmA n=1 Tax=Luedemannella helvata TaxID=349315 RepID=A0ABP4XC73_9ACTN